LTQCVRSAPGQVANGGKTLQFSSNPVRPLPARKKLERKKNGEYGKLTGEGKKKEKKKNGSWIFSAKSTALNRLRDNGKPDSGSNTGEQKKTRLTGSGKKKDERSPTREKKERKLTFKLKTLMKHREEDIPRPHGPEGSYKNEGEKNQAGRRPRKKPAPTVWKLQVS